MQVALARPGYTYGHEWFSSTRTEQWAGPGAGREHAIAPLVTLLRVNRMYMLALLHHLLGPEIGTCGSRVPQSRNGCACGRVTGP
jgi:hypothetical protein